MPSDFAFLPRSTFTAHREKRCAFILPLLLVFFLAGCVNSTAVMAFAGSPSPQPRPTLTVTQTVEIEKTPAIGQESTPTAAAPVETLPPMPTVTSRPEDAPVLEGEWRLFSDPNYIQDLVQVNDQLWAATLGGVVAWDLRNDQPRLYTTDDGLAEIQALAVAYCPSSEKEQIFIGHESGLISLFDRETEKWSQVYPGDPNAFSQGPIEALYCDSPRNRLLAGGPGGIDILDLQSNQWVHVGAKQGMTARTVRDMVVFDRTIWIAAGAQGGFLINDQRAVALSYLNQYPNGEIDDVAVNARGGLWFVRPAGLALFWSLDRSMIQYGAQTAAGVPIGYVDHLEIGPDGQIWIGGSNEGVCPFDPKKRFCSTFYSPPSGFSVTVLRASRDRTAYMGTSGGGILALLPDGVRKLVFPSQIHGSQVNSLVEDTSGKLWAVTHRGMNWFDLSNQQEGWHLLDAGQGSLVSNHVRGARSFSNRFWLFYEDSPAISFLEDDTWHQLPGPLPWQQVWDIRMDSAGYVWIASDKGIFSWDGVTIQPFLPASSLQMETGCVLFPDGNTLWVGTQYGLWKCHDLECESTNLRGKVLQILPEQDGGLLLGTEKGLVRYNGGIGSPVMITLDSVTAIWPVVTAVAQDLDQNLWVGTRGDGLFILVGNQWHQITVGAGRLPAGNIRSITVDHLGTVWIAAGNQMGGGALIRYSPVK